MADRLSLKWIEGNDVVTLSGGTFTTPIDIHINGNTENVPTFDVDNPIMWTPLSVLSGLASGYCERRAVLNSTFITGTTTQGGIETDIETTWDQESIEPADITARDTIVTNLMHNLALGNVGESTIYKKANANMTPIGSVTVSNYMTAMDSAITALISGTNVFVDATGANYESIDKAAFDNVASAAYNTAGSQPSEVSAISLPSSDGGDLKTAMAPGLPIEWAKERKWMLDELKWTGGGGASTEQVLITGDYNKVILKSSGYSSNGATGQALYSAAMLNGLDSETWDGYFGSYMNLSSGTSLTSDTTIVYAHSAGVMYDPDTPVSSGIATIYAGKAIGLASSATMDRVDYYELTNITGAVVADGDGRYCIAAGGTFTIPTGVSAQAVFVESGATLQMAGGTVGIVNVMNGGRYFPNVVSNGQYVDSFDFRTVFQNYTASTSVTDGNIGLYPTSNYSHMEYINNVTNTNSDVRNVYVTGTTATGSATIIYTGAASTFYGVAASRGKLTVSGSGINANVIAQVGGTVEIGSGVRLGALTIASGGKAFLHTGWNTLANYTGIYLYSGGSLTLDGVPKVDTTRFNIIMEEGAYLSIPASAGLYKIHLTHYHYEHPTSSFTFYTFIPPADLIAGMGTAGNIYDGGYYFGSASLYQFNNFGLAYQVGAGQTGTPFIEGWNRIPCSAIYDATLQDDIVKLAGVATFDEAKTIAASTSILPKVPRTAGASGTVSFASWSIVATTTSSTNTGVVTNYTSTSEGTGSMEAFAAFYDHDRSFLINSFRKLAVNKLSGAKNHYSEFYVRQFPTQAEIDQATSSATST